MTNPTRDTLLRQLDIAWTLTRFHLDGLSTAECLWRPAKRGLHVHQTADQTWRADWPEHEGYDLGPSSIGWLTWHLGFWWSMVWNHSFGDRTLLRESITWPGNAGAVRQWIGQLQHQWQTQLESMTDYDLRSESHTQWPFQNRPFADVVAWANLELTKNAAEIGYARFLYAQLETGTADQLRPDESLAAGVRPGRYRHYKGNDYLVLGVARHSETQEEWVVYRTDYGNRGLWVRPRAMFTEIIEVNGKRVPRFAFVREAFDGDT